MTSALPWVQEKFSSFFFLVPVFVLVRDCRVLSSFLHFPSETGNINCFLRIVLFSSHPFRARNKEEEILTPVSLVVSSLVKIPALGQEKEWEWLKTEVESVAWITKW